MYNPQDGYIIPMAIMDFNIYLNLLREEKRKKEENSKTKGGHSPIL